MSFGPNADMNKYFFLGPLSGIFFNKNRCQIHSLIHMYLLYSSSCSNTDPGDLINYGNRLRDPKGHSSQEWWSMDNALTHLGCVYKLTELIFFNFTALLYQCFIYFCVLLLDNEDDWSWKYTVFLLTNYLPNIYQMPMTQVVTEEDWSVNCLQRFSSPSSFPS